MSLLPSVKVTIPKAEVEEGFTSNPAKYGIVALIMVLV
jgi:hypothetical protein